MVEFSDQVHACRAASVPAISVVTVEQKDVRTHLCQYAVTRGTQKTGVRPRIFEWRLVDGFKELAIYKKVNKSTQVIESANDMTDFIGTKVEYVKGAHYEPKNGAEGSTIPFAIQWMSDYPEWAKKEYSIPEGEAAPGAIFILRDWHNWIGHNKYLVDMTLKLFEEVAGRGLDILVVMLAPTTIDIPDELGEWIDSSQLPIPDQEGRIDSVSRMVKQLKTKRKGEYPLIEAMEQMDIETVATTCGGLSSVGIENLLCKSIALTKNLDTDYILSEKAKKVSEMGYELLTTDVSMEDVGGLQNMKEGVELLRPRFTAEALEFGFTRYPVGWLLAGVPGTGKTLSAKALAKELGINIMQVKPHNLKNEYVGGSERQVEKLLATARAAAPIGIMLDEAEKMLGKQDRVSDGGAHSAVLGQFLNFMSEEAGALGVFFIFTANDMSKFPVELVRRFDGRYFVDLPSANGREMIFRIHLSKRKHNGDDYDLAELARLTNEYSGSDIEQAIELGMSYAFAKGREKTEQQDFVKAIKKTVPTAKTYAEQIANMRRWVTDGTMTPANSDSISLTEPENDSLRNVI
jgi:ATP-dependent 26S proteasome regulatory subunit